MKIMSKTNGTHYGICYLDANIKEVFELKTGLT